MKRSYLDYAMSVIVSRALPDVRDGLKPVHRRILFGMNELGVDWNKKYVKCARVVGEVMGKFHPHGNLAIYDALVRMAQDFSMRLPLIDGQGNFGSIDGDPPAAERYTECRLAKVAHALLDDLDKDTVEFRDNYDGSLKEPSVLPAKFPNLLVNGSGGIAVGMATNIPPHNLGEVIDACIAHLDNPEISIDELTQIVPGPDFPTGALILGRAGIVVGLPQGPRLHHHARQGAHRGDPQGPRGADRHRHPLPGEQARADREDRRAGAREAHRGHLRHLGRVQPRRHARRHRAEARRHRRRGAEPALASFRPADHRSAPTCWPSTAAGPSSSTSRISSPPSRPSARRSCRRRTKHLLAKSRDRAHVLVGLAVAVANIDEMIRLIRSAPSPAEAREQMMARDWPAKDIGPLVELIADPRHKLTAGGTIRLSDEQARAILDLRLQRLTALGRDEIGDELKKLGEEIKEFLAILASRVRIVDLIKGELSAIKTEFATPRLTEIVEMEGEVEDEDLIQREDVVVTVSHRGYIKRVPLSTYRAQRRGGKGRSGMSTRDEDVVTQIFIASTHTPLLFFSSRGMAYRMKVWRLPAATPQSIGKALVNLLPLAEGEVITSILPLPEDQTTWGALELMFATRNGNVRRNSLADFETINRNGKIAMKLDEGDSIVRVAICRPGVPGRSCDDPKRIRAPRRPMRRRCERPTSRAGKVRHHWTTCC